MLYDSFERSNTFLCITNAASSLLLWAGVCPIGMLQAEWICR